MVTELKQALEGMAKSLFGNVEVRNSQQWPLTNIHGYDAAHVHVR